MFRIKDLREDNNKSQTEIAKILGIQQNSYSQIENRCKQFTNRPLNKTCKIL